MFDDISHQIRSSKKTLRKKSKDYILNFKKIEKFIKKEIREIEELKKSSNEIIPEINFHKLNKPQLSIIDAIHRRGLCIYRDVFEDTK